MSDVDVPLTEVALLPLGGPSEMSGVRAGIIVFASVAVTNLANYGFHLLSARQLGPSSYGDVATLTTISGILTLPLAGAQAFVARHVATTGVRGRTLNADGYVTGFGGALAVAGMIVTIALLALSPLLGSALSITSLSAIVLTVLVTVPSFVVPALVGALQGRQRFALFAAATGVPSVIRVALAAVALHAGLGVPGVMGATLAAAVIAVVIPLAMLRHSIDLRHGWRPRLPRRDALALLPVVAGMLAITCLSSDDLVAAKVSLSAHEAGIYSSGSLIGRVILYLPAAIITVLLPKVSARVSASGDMGHIFVRCVVATAAFCALATAIYAAVPHLIVRIAFGSTYQGSAPLLWMFGVAMTLYALLNVLLIYRVGHGEAETCWLLLGGAVVQAAAFAFLHSSPRELLSVSIATGAVLVAVAIVGPSNRSPVSLRAMRTLAAARS